MSRHRRISPTRRRLVLLAAATGALLSLGVVAAWASSGWTATSTATASGHAAEVFPATSASATPSPSATGTTPSSTPTATPTAAPPTATSTAAPQQLIEPRTSASPKARRPKPPKSTDPVETPDADTSSSAPAGPAPSTT